MEYAIRQSAAIAHEGVEVYFLCKESFPKERLAAGIVVEKFVESRVLSDLRRGLVGKISTFLKLTLGQWRNAKRVAELALKLSQATSTRDPLPVTRYNLGSAEVVVLFACFKEYFSPFWVWSLRRLAKKGVVIGTIAHDPVRDFVVGPLWWHRWSVRLGYSFVRHVFVHDDTPVDFGGRQPERIQVHQIPHGPYEVSPPKIGRLEMRRRLGFTSDSTTIEQRGRGEIEQPKVGPKGEGVGTIESKSTEEEGKDLSHGGTANTERAARVARPHLCFQTGVSEPDSLPSKLADSPASESLTRSASGPASSPATSHSLLAAAPDVVFLAFGQIRDGKNLDLFLRAMTLLPKNVKLLVAGTGDSGSSKPPEFYQKLAEELGVAERCRWDIRRIPEDEVGDIFAASDVVLVTYSAKFRSASGVLNTAVSARKPLLASSGPGPLENTVNKYHLGVFVEPDNCQEILRGASQILVSLSPPVTQNQDTQHLRLDACIYPDWDQYERKNSWMKNAQNILNSMSMILNYSK